MDKRNGWLEKVKVGDVLIHKSVGIIDSFEVLVEVEKISPTGRIKIKGDKYSFSAKEGKREVKKGRFSNCESLHKDIKQGGK